MVRVVRELRAGAAGEVTARRADLGVAILPELSPSGAGEGVAGGGRRNH